MNSANQKESSVLTLFLDLNCGKIALGDSSESFESSSDFLESHRSLKRKFRTGSVFSGNRAYGPIDCCNQLKSFNLKLISRIWLTGPLWWSVCRSKDFRLFHMPEHHPKAFSTKRLVFFYEIWFYECEFECDYLVDNFPTARRLLLFVVVVYRTRTIWPASSKWWLWT